MYFCVLTVSALKSRRMASVPLLSEEQQHTESLQPTRSLHFVSRAEAIKGISNRFVFSTFYIYLYLAMAALSSVTLLSTPCRNPASNSPLPTQSPFLPSPQPNSLNFTPSFTTVVLSILSDCPTLTFYVLEIIVNTAMITEVSIRLIAFGSVRPLQPRTSQPRFSYSRKHRAKVWSQQSGN